MHSLKAVKITDRVYWTGAIDWGVRNFHGYTTNSGTTYNAYLVLGEKITLIDTVKKGFESEMMARVSSVVDPSSIDYIVSNHSEPDHSGVLPQVIKEVNPEKVFASIMGAKALKEHYHDFPGEIIPVCDGERLSLGNMNLLFMETRMLHWPDSMFSFLEEEKLLFSQDAFGMHLATSERFDDELDFSLLEKMSADYYANIITLYSPQVEKLLAKVAASGLEFRIVAPDHGPVWRNMENFGRILSLYGRWAAREFSPRAVIVYDTMWKSTEIMARYIEDGIRSSGVHADVMPLYSCDRSDVASKLLDAAAIVAGAPTLNNNLYPSMADVLTYLRGLRFRTPFGAAFGSYGWSGESVGQIKEYLTGMTGEVTGSLSAKYVPDDQVKRSAYEFGADIAGRIKEYFNITKGEKK